MGVDEAAAVDGRKQRSERSRLAIIEAGLSLMKEGVLIPTAQQIVDRAGVGIRSLFRHFSDMDSFFAAVDEYERSTYESYFTPVDSSGSLEERIPRMVEVFSGGYELVSDMVLSTLAQRWHSEVLRQNYARNQRHLAKKIEQWLPETKGLNRQDRHALEAIMSFEFWHRLREHQGLGVRAGRNLINNLVSGFFS